ncbi:MAG: CoA transferase [Chloroflexi bacterium]|nr:CoA transferase [Chloroflexota bacterium]
MQGILSNVKVLELTHSLAGAFCAKLMGDQGANVIKIEPPGRGDGARHEPPFIGGAPHPERSTLFLAYNTNKRGVTLDVGTPSGKELFLRLVKETDVLVESHTPSSLEEMGLEFTALQEVNPRLVLTSITYFGQNGPYTDYHGDDLIAQALGGFLYAVTGLADRPPMGTALYQMEVTAARNAAIATMAALVQQGDTGEGQHIDVSTFEATVSVPGGLIQQYTYLGGVQRRGGGENSVMDGMHLKTLDGEVTLTTAGTGGRAMEAWAEFLGEPAILDPKFTDRRTRTRNWKELYDLVQNKLAQWNNLDLMREATARGLVIGLVQDPVQVATSPHLQERGFLLELDHPEAGRLKYPGPAFLLDGENPSAGGRAAPTLGEHNLEVYCGQLGLSTHELSALAAAGVV